MAFFNRVLNRFKRRKTKNNKQKRANTKPSNNRPAPMPKRMPNRMPNQSSNLAKLARPSTPPPPAPRAAPYTPPRKPGRPTQDYIAELQKLDKSSAHAVGRLTLQLAKVKARPDLASYVRRAQLNVQRAKQISKEVKLQLANAQKGVWAERVMSYRGPGKWSYVPGAKELTQRITSRAAQRNTLLGQPTLNRYHEKHGNQMAKAQAALNKLSAGNNMITENEARLLQGQLARVTQKKSRQGGQGVFNWEKKLLAHAPLIKQVANMYAKPLNNSNLYSSNNNNGSKQRNRNTLTRMFAMINAANTKLWQGKSLTANEIKVLQFRNSLLGK